ncbi:MAG TPA: hypothetical protein VK019_07550 [Pseudomonas sp.]|nr:hypothetical protein [Pseudomonas sp.]
MGIALIVAGLERWIGSGRAKFHDLTRPGAFIDQATREHNNTLAIETYFARCEALNVPRIRPLPTNEGN